MAESIYCSETDQHCGFTSVAAFAELQTEVTDLTGDLTLGGIPFLDYRTYARKILFPNMDDLAVLQWEQPELHRKEKGLRLFGQLEFWRN